MKLFLSLFVHSLAYFKTYEKQCAVNNRKYRILKWFDYIFYDPSGQPLSNVFSSITIKINHRCGSTPLGSEDCKIDSRYCCGPFCKYQGYTSYDEYYIFDSDQPHFYFIGNASLEEEPETLALDDNNKYYTIYEIIRKLGRPGNKSIGSCGCMDNVCYCNGRCFCATECPPCPTDIPAPTIVPPLPTFVPYPSGKPSPSPYPYHTPLAPDYKTYYYYDFQEMGTNNYKVEGSSRKPNEYNYNVKRILLDHPIGSIISLNPFDIIKQYLGWLLFILSLAVLFYSIYLKIIAVGFELKPYVPLIISLAISIYSASVASANKTLCTCGKDLSICNWPINGKFTIGDYLVTVKTDLYLDCHQALMVIINEAGYCKSVACEGYDTSSRYSDNDLCFKYFNSKRNTLFKCGSKERPYHYSNTGCKDQHPHKCNLHYNVRDWKWLTILDVIPGKICRSPKLKTDVSIEPYMQLDYSIHQVIGFNQEFPDWTFYAESTGEYFNLDSTKQLSGNSVHFIDDTDPMWDQKNSFYREHWVEVHDVDDSGILTQTLSDEFNEMISKFDLSDPGYCAREIKDHLSYGYYTRHIDGLYAGKLLSGEYMVVSYKSDKCSEFKDNGKGKFTLNGKLITLFPDEVFKGLDTLISTGYVLGEEDYLLFTFNDQCQFSYPGSSKDYPDYQNCKETNLDPKDGTDGVELPPSRVPKTGLDYLWIFQTITLIVFCSWDFYKYLLPKLLKRPKKIYPEDESLSDAQETMSGNPKETQNQSNPSFEISPKVVIRSPNKNSLKKDSPGTFRPEDNFYDYDELSNSSKDA